MQIAMSLLLHTSCGCET